MTSSGTPPGSATRLRFGEFELDLRSHELRRAGRSVRLQEKAFLVLKQLVERPGEVVTREELQAALWPKEYFVDSEHGLNTAVRRLREALGDSAEATRYVETLPKIGYRFRATIEAAARPEVAIDGPGAEAASRTDDLPRADPPTARVRVSARMGVAAAAVVVLAAVYFVAIGRVPGRSAPATPPPLSAEVERVDELLARARYLFNVKRFDESKRFFEQAISLDPGNGGAMGGLGLVFLAQGQLEPAGRAARRALELGAKTGDAHATLGYLARAAGDFVQAEREFHEAVEIEPASGKARNRLARHLLEIGRFAEAEEQVREARRLDPDNPDVQNIRIELYLRTGEYEAAIQEGESWLAIWAKTIEGQPTPTIRDQLGLALVGARRPEAAIAQFHAVDPDDRLRPALVLGYMGQADEAIAILDEEERRRHDAGTAGPPLEVEAAVSGAIAMAAVTAGDFDRAFDHLERQIAANWYPGWLACPLFDPIRRDRRFEALSEKIERTFFSGQSKPTSPFFFAVVQSWPRRPPPGPRAASG